MSATTTNNDKWDRRYSGKTPAIKPCQLLQNFADQLPQQGRALDLACGLGGNALFLAERGLHCEALDYSPVAIKALNTFALQHNLSVSAAVRDIEQDYLPPESRYDVIVVSYFLFRPLLSAINQALAPGGLLFYQTFNRKRPECGGPQNPDFLLAEGELPKAMPELTVVFNDEDYLAVSGRPAESAIILQKPC